MNETELKAGYESQKPLLLAWGEIVKETICAGVAERLLPSRKLEHFLKIPVTVRVKEAESFLAKALRRGQRYERPLDEITDRVGVRFVVLLRSDLSVVHAAIADGKQWEAEITRDFEAEQAERPHHFDYQSDHYILRTIKPIKVGTLMIPACFPCEVQVRTLLQHAYAELAHDTTYKPSVMVDRAVLRQVAKGSALVETTDEVFVKVAEQIERSSAEVRRVHDIAAIAYQKLLGFAGNDDIRLSFAIMDRYREVLSSITQESLSAFIEKNDFIKSKIRERGPLSILVPPM